MDIREWIANNVGYRFFGCCYNNRFNKQQEALFKLIKSKIPNEFLDKQISDLGCGDGSNTLRIKEIFKPRIITGYEHNDYLVEKARKKGLKIKKIDLDKKIPKGEIAVFTFALHHLKNKEKVLKKVVDNFDYVFLCEPIRDLYHALLDGGKPLSKEKWLYLFDNVFKEYKLYQHKSSLIVFYKKPTK